MYNQYCSCQMVKKSLFIGLERREVNQTLCTKLMNDPTITENRSTD